MLCFGCCFKHQSTSESSAQTCVQDATLPASDPFFDDDFNDFFQNDVLSSRNSQGDYNFKLVEHKLIDIQASDLQLSIINSDVQLLGGGDTSTTNAIQVGSQSDVTNITQKVRVYASIESFDLKVPGLRQQQIQRLSRLKDLYLRKLSFYVDEDSYLMLNWEVASMRNNSQIVDKTNKLRSKDKVSIITLTIQTDWLRTALEYIRDIGISVSTITEHNSETTPGLDLHGVYALDELTGSGPRLVKNIVLSVFSNSDFEKAENKLELVLQRNAHKHFSAQKICQTMLRICKAANLSPSEFHAYMRHLRDPNIPTCPCGFKGSTQEAWAIHGCTYEAWVIRIGIAQEIGGYLRFNSFDWPTVLQLSIDSISDNI